jgi:glutaredoxin 3
MVQAPRTNMPAIEIYTTRYCPYCHAAKRLLSRKGVAFTEIDVSGNPAGRSSMVARANGRMTVPQIFIGATHVGGYDDLHALDQAGKLDPLLAAGTGGPLLATREASA